MNTMMFKNNLFKSCLAVAIVASATACSDNDGPSPDRNSNEVEFFIAASQDSKNYLLAVPDITTQESVSIVGQGMETDQSYGTWLFPSEYVGIGLSYQKGNPGLGMGVALGADGNIIKNGGDFQIASRFTTYGTFQGKVLTVVDGINVADDAKNLYSTFNFVDPENNNAVKPVTKNTTNITGNGESAVLSGVVQFGSNNFLTALAPRKIVQEKDDDGKLKLGTEDTAYPDSVWVASFDKDLNVTKLYGDDRISYAAGRHRSGFRNMIGSDDNDNVYVFSPSVDDRSTKPAGVIRIPSGAAEFDPDYYWNLEEEVAKTGADPEIKFKDMYHITGDYFVLQYMRPGTTETDGTTTQNAMAIVNVAEKTFKWVEGLPDYNNNPEFGSPMSEDGLFYTPVTEKDKAPAIYIIDPVTATATKGITINAASVSGIGKLRQR